MKQKNISFYGGILFCLSLAACSHGESSPSSSPGTVQQNAWINQQSAAPDGSVSALQSEMTAAELASIRNSYKRVNLEQIPIDSKFNAIVFRITDETIPDDLDQAFIAPKLFFYGSEEGGRLASFPNADGSTTISFSVAFVDGLTKTVPSPGGDEDIVLPDNFVLQDQAELETLLKTDFKIDRSLAPLAGCPKKITVSAGGNEFDATPTDLKMGDFCQMNVAIPVSFTLNADEAKSFLMDALPNGLVDVRGVYETRVSFPVSNVKLTFDRTRIYQDLEAELGVKAWIVDADVKAAVTRVMQNQLMKVSIQGDTNEMLSALITQITQQFFLPFNADPSVAGSDGCGTAKICFRLAFDQVSQSNTLEFDWVQATDSITGQNYLTSAQVKATPNQVRIGRDESCAADCGRLKNDSTPRELGLTVKSGDEVSIEPDYIVMETSDSVGQTHRVDHPTCVRSHQQCLQGIVGLLEGPNCQTICDENVDEWEDITVYDGNLTSVIVNQPVGVIAELYQGLSLSFESRDEETGEMKTVECPLGVFPQTGDGRSIQVKLQNGPTCSPFDQNGMNTPLLSLVNHISIPGTILTGRLVKNWQGTVEESPSQTSFNPWIEFAGSVSVLAQ